MKLNNFSRLRDAVKAMSWHFTASLLVAAGVGLLVFGVWYPYPYREFSGGKELFFLVMGVDLVCGPLLTGVLFNPAKPRRELVVDLSIVVALQLAALAYGVWTVWQARPLYLVHEVDRFKTIALPDVDAAALSKLPASLQLHFFKGPQTVGLREATEEERQKVMFESVQGGRDYGERPEFYAPYDATNAAKAYAKAKPLNKFIDSSPDKKQARQAEANKISAILASSTSAITSSITPAISSATPQDQLRYLPIMARQDWVAVLDTKGKIVGYIKGDGF